MLEKIKKMYNSKPGFIIFGLLWIIHAGIIPIIIINSKYPLFRRSVGKLQFCGWALVALIITFLVLNTICNYIIKAFTTRYSFWTKCLKGFKKVILPLTILYLFLDVASRNISVIKYVLSAIIVSEAIAIIINPFPKWIVQHNVIGVEKQ